MTVAELIEKLQAMPQDAVVIVPHEWRQSGWVPAESAEGMLGKINDGDVCTDEPLNRRDFERSLGAPVEICAIS